MRTARPCLLLALPLALASLCGGTMDNFLEDPQESRNLESILIETVFNPVGQITFRNSIDKLMTIVGYYLKGLPHFLVENISGHQFRKRDMSWARAEDELQLKDSQELRSNILKFASPLQQLLHRHKRNANLEAEAKGDREANVIQKAEEMAEDIRWVFNSSPDWAALLLNWTAQAAEEFLSLEAKKHELDQEAMRLGLKSRVKRNTLVQRLQGLNLFRRNVTDYQNQAGLRLTNLIRNVNNIASAFLNWTMSTADEIFEFDR